MNEGWASYWHARLLREADFLPHDLYLSAIKAHSDVVRPYASGDQVALSINPYHLGFSMWEHIIETRGLAAARQICKEEDDFGFIRNYLDEDLAEKNWDCSSIRPIRMVKSRSPTATFTRCEKRSSRPNSITAHQGWLPACCTSTAAWN
ncbi:SpoVR family protein [Undibacterium arcticum]